MKFDFKKMLVTAGSVAVGLVIFHMVKKHINKICSFTYHYRNLMPYKGKTFSKLNKKFGNVL